MGKSTRNGLLALLGLGALAFWKYKTATPEEKQKVKDTLDSAKKNLEKMSGDIKNKANEIVDQVKNKANEYQQN